MSISVSKTNTIKQEEPYCEFNRLKCDNQYLHCNRHYISLDIADMFISNKQVTKQSSQWYTWFSLQLHL